MLAGWSSDPSLSQLTVGQPGVEDTVEVSVMVTSLQEAGSQHTSLSISSVVVVVVVVVVVDDDVGVVVC